LTCHVYFSQFSQRSSRSANQFGVVSQSHQHSRKWRYYIGQILCIHHSNWSRTNPFSRSHRQHILWWTHGSNWSGSVKKYINSMCIADLDTEKIPEIIISLKWRGGRDEKLSINFNWHYCWDKNIYRCQIKIFLPVLNDLIFNSRSWPKMLSNWQPTCLDL
jgi:hypothetical protein